MEYLKDPYVVASIAGVVVAGGMMMTDKIRKKECDYKNYAFYFVLVALIVLGALKMGGSAVVENTEELLTKPFDTQLE